jgi:hypothetical protein
MYFTNIEYTCEIGLHESHSISFLSHWGWFSDSLNIVVDGQKVLSIRVGWRGWYGSHSFMLDDEKLEIHWRWNMLWGNPIYILLTTGNTILAQYGNRKKIDRLGYTKGEAGNSTTDFTSIQVVKEIKDSESSTVVATEKYPFDNRHGTDTMSIEQEITKTLSNTLKIDTTTQTSIGLNATLFKVLEAHLSRELSTQIGETIGETVKRRHQFTFSVKPGSFVLYKINWKNTARRGLYTIKINRQKIDIGYEALFGLSYEIASEQGTSE